MPTQQSVHPTLGTAASRRAQISSSFTRLFIFLAGRLRRPRPSAGNANRWAFPFQTHIYMNLPSFSKLTISLLLVLVACTTQATPSTPTILPPSPTPDLEIITPENVDRLIQVKQLGVGLVCGSPHFSSDGKWVYQATTTGVFAFDTKTYEGHRLISSTIAYNCSVDVSPDGKLLAVNENLFAVESGEKLPDLETSLEFQDWAGASEVKFSPDGSLLARRYYENSKNGTQFHIAIWRLADGELINIFFDVGSYYFPFISFSMDGNFLIAQSNDASNSKLDLYDIQAGVKLRSWTGVHSVLLPKSQVAIETDGVVHIIDLKTDNNFTLCRKTLNLQRDLLFFWMVMTSKVSKKNNK